MQRDHLSMVGTLAALLDDLHRRRVVRIGPRERLQVEALIHSQHEWRADELAAALASVLATSSEAWAAVYQEVRHAVVPEQVGSPAEATVQLDPPRPLTPAERRAETRASRRARWTRRLLGLRGGLLAALIALGLVVGAGAVLGLLAWLEAEPEPPPVATPATAETQAPPAPLGASAPGTAVVQLQVEPEGRATLTVEKVLPASAWAALGVLIVTSLGFVTFAVRWAALPATVAMARAQAERDRLDRREAEAAWGPGAGRVYRVERFLPLPAAAIDDAGALLCHPRPAGHRDDLDVGATIQRAVRGGGRVMPVYAASTRAPEILVLLDTELEGGGHPFLDAAEQVLARWVSHGVRLEIHRYAGSWEPRQLDDLARRTADLPLLLVSRLAQAGTTTGTGRPWIQRLRAWPQRAFLDLDPRLPEGGARARELANLSAAAVPRFPFTAEGLLAMARALGLGEAPVRAPAEPTLPAAAEVREALWRWAVVAALVPDPSWAQLEALRRRFPEISSRLPHLGCLQLLLEWVEAQGFAHGLRGPPLLDMGRKLALPPGLVRALLAECRARPDGEVIERSARQLLLDQLRGATPETPLEQAENRIKQAWHRAVLDPTQIAALLEELKHSPLSPELAEDLRVELGLQREGQVCGEGLRAADLERVSDLVEVQTEPRVPLRALLTRPLGLQARTAAALGALLGLSWGGWAAWTSRRVEQVEVAGSVERPATSSVLIEPLGVSPKPALADTAQPMRFLRLRGGTFRMGSEAGAGNDDEHPAHAVTVRAFEIGLTEVTQGQWEAVMGENPSDCDYGCGAELPVQGVRWLDVVDFLNRLSAREGLSACYTVSGQDVSWAQGCEGYRLPTEAEWEYAARAGTQTAWSWGDDATGADAHAWYSANSELKVHAVGEKAPNPWGLHDVHGNVWEWVWDWYADAYVDTVVDKGGPPQGQYRVLRGGSFDYVPSVLRSSLRYWLRPSVRYRFIGTRCARGSRPSIEPSTP